MCGMSLGLRTSGGVLRMQYFLARVVPAFMLTLLSWVGPCTNNTQMNSVSHNM